MTNALESSLWELYSHRQHYHAAVSTLAKIFEEAFTRPGYAMEDFLDHTYGTVSLTLFFLIAPPPIPSPPLPSPIPSATMAATNNHLLPLRTPQASTPKAPTTTTTPGSRRAISAEPTAITASGKRLSLSARRRIAVAPPSTTLTPHAKAAYRSLDQRRAAIFTPRAGRRRRSSRRGAITPKGTTGARPSGPAHFVLHVCVCVCARVCCVALCCVLCIEHPLSWRLCTGICMNVANVRHAKVREGRGEEGSPAFSFIGSDRGSGAYSRHPHMAAVVGGWVGR